VPGVNHLKTFGRWAFRELTDVWEMQAEFEATVAARVEALIDAAAGAAVR
jgi:type III restriction enzyme